MNLFRKRGFVTSATLSASLVLVACASPAAPREIVLSTTTSTYDSGLLDFMLPVFTEETGIGVVVLSEGTGAALQLGRDGEADVVLVHARSAEEQFVEEGYAESRHDVMYNDFIVIGPSHVDMGNHPDVGSFFMQLLEEDLPFVSRGDNSGTHIRELEIWDSIGLEAPVDSANYIEVGQGMGATISMTVELDAFTLSDRSTWYSFPEPGNLSIHFEGGEDLRNPYGIMQVVGATNESEAVEFMNWFLSDEAAALIGEFGVEEFGSPLFFSQR